MADYEKFGQTEEKKRTSIPEAMGSPSKKSHKTKSLLVKRGLGKVQMTHRASMAGTRKKNVFARSEV